jgi:tRNA pseudouridine13 synthase
MYIHAYQSYVWNAIVSERIRTWGCEKPIVGDLVFDSTITVEEEDPESVSIDPADADITVENVLGAESVVEASQVPVPSSSTPSKGKPPAATTTKSRKPWSPPRVKTLAPEDLDKYTIFDVIMPLPGKDVDYPGGDLGEKYREYLRMDGLDPDHLERKQKSVSTPEYPPSAKTGLPTETTASAGHIGKFCTCQRSCHGLSCATPILTSPWRKPTKISCLDLTRHRW